MSRLAMLLAVLTILGVACGGEELDRSPLPTRPPSTPVFIPTATSTVVPALSDVEVKRALITLGDLPSTWYNADTRAPADNDSERCEVPDPLSVNVPTAEATETFSASLTGPWIAETIFQLQSTEQAESLMADLRESFSCGAWAQSVEPKPTATPDAQATPKPAESTGPTPASEEPEEIIWDIAAPDEIDLRQGAFITRMISNTPEPIEYELVFIHANNLIILVSHWGREGVNTDITMSIVERSLEKLDQTFAG